MLLSGSKCTASYDPHTGKELWMMDGPTEQFVASLVDDGRLVYLTAGFPERHILAIDPSGQGKVSDEKIVWRTKKNCAYVPSPVICGDYLIVAADDGIASCYHAAGTSNDRSGKHYSASSDRRGSLSLADDGITKVSAPAALEAWRNPSANTATLPRHQPRAPPPRETPVLHRQVT
jgi:hypothetical protein